MTGTSQAGALWRVVLIWLAGLGAAAQYGKISIAYELLGGHYPEAGAQLGFVVSLVGFVGILFGVAAGVFASALGFRRVLIGGLLLGALLSLYQASLPSLPLFLASRVVEGLSHLAIVVAAPTLISGICPERYRNLALTFWGTFFGVAFALLALFGVPLAERSGVDALLLGHAVFMVFMALLMWRILPPDTPSMNTHLPNLSEVISRHRAIYRSPAISAPGVGWIFYTFGFVSLLTLLPPFIDPAIRGVVMAAMPLVGIATSLLLGVPLLRIMPAVKVVQLGFLLAFVFALALLVAPGAPVFCLALSGAMGLVQGASFAAVPQLNDTMEDRSLSNGGLAQAGNLGNTTGTPVLALVIALSGFSGMMWVLAAVFLIGALAHAGLARQRRTGEVG